MKYFFVLLVFSACIKLDQPNEMTGVWSSDDGIIYSFFDDSRFKQSDLPGQQWIWEKKGVRIFFYGSPDRIWTVDFVDQTHVQVIETDTFNIERK